MERKNYCPRCRLRIGGYLLFCPNCGNALEEDKGEDFLSEQKEEDRNDTENAGIQDEKKDITEDLQDMGMELPEDTSYSEKQVMKSGEYAEGAHDTGINSSETPVKVQKKGQGKGFKRLVYIGGVVLGIYLLGNMIGANDSKNLPETENTADVQEQNAADAQGQNAADAQGQNAADAQGQNVADAQGQNVADAQGQNVADAQGQNVADAQGQNAVDAQEQNTADVQQNETTKPQVKKTSQKKNKKKNKNSKEYILPNSDSQYIRLSDLKGLTAKECRLARNELFARHGRLFDDKELQKYFNSKSWYKGTVKPEDFDESVFNKYEVVNRDFIVKYEEKKGYR